MSATTVDSFVADWADWRLERDRQLAEPYSILAITSINYLTADPLEIESIPGRWSTSDDGPVVELAIDEQLTDGDTQLSGRVELGRLGGRPPLRLGHGDVQVQVMNVSGWDIVRPHDPNAPRRTGFSGTPTFSPDPRWVLDGHWVPYVAPRRTTIDSVQERLGFVMDAPGEVEFELDGRHHRLVATPAHAAPGHVALLFRDRTSGVTTYPAQRELLVQLPESGDRVVLDFNRAQNKNCAYTDFAICPLPPAGNTVDVAIEAGERTPYERLQSS